MATRKTPTARKPRASKQAAYAALQAEVREVVQFYVDEIAFLQALVARCPSPAPEWCWPICDQLYRVHQFHARQFERANASQEEAAEHARNVQSFVTMEWDEDVVESSTPAAPGWFAVFATEQGWELTPVVAFAQVRSVHKRRLSLGDLRRAIDFPDRPGDCRTAAIAALSAGDGHPMILSTEDDHWTGFAGLVGPTENATDVAPALAARWHQLNPKEDT